MEHSPKVEKFTLKSCIKSILLGTNIYEVVIISDPTKAARLNLKFSSRNSHANVPGKFNAKAEITLLSTLLCF